MQEFLAERNIEAEEVVNATKNKLGKDTALELSKEVDRILIVKGKKAHDFDMLNDPPDEETLLKQMLGPTGNLRAPTVRMGNTLYIGYNYDHFNEEF